MESKKRRWVVAVVILFLFLVPAIFRNDYFLHLLIYACMYGILGMGFSMLWKNHLITCGHAGLFAVGAYTSALLVTKAGFSFWLALPAAGLASALFGLIIFSAALRAGPLVFFGMSLVSSFIVMEVCGTVEYFGGWEGLMGIPRPKLGSFVFLSKSSYYYLVMVLLLLNVLAFSALYRSRIGRAWTAIGSSVRLAQAQGIHVYRYRLAAAIISSFSAGVIGSFYAHYQSLLVPNTFSFLLSIYVQMFALIGGLGFFIAGPIVGACVMVFLPEWLRLTEQFQPILYSILIILIVIFLPGGILSLPKRYPVLVSWFRWGRGKSPVRG